MFGVASRRSNGVSGEMKDNLADRLHDGPIQDLVAARAELTALMNASQEHRALLGSLASSIEAALGELRTIIREGVDAETARPELAAGRPDLYAELCELSTEFRKESGLSCTFEILPEHTQFGYYLSNVLYRCMRELLINVRKHAQASKVRMLSGSYDASSIYLAVEDDGVGFGANGTVRSLRPDIGFGLWSIEHRLHRFDGFTDIENRNGVCVRIVLPARLLEG